MPLRRACGSEARDRTLLDASRSAGAPALRVDSVTGGTFAHMPIEPPGVLPPLPGFLATPIRDPALLPDGTVVWAPTHATLVASCVSDGRTRWILEHDPFPFNFYRSVFATADGEILLLGGIVYRIAPNGEVLATREAPLPGAPLGWSEECGLATLTTRELPGGLRESEGISYLRGRSLDEESHLARSLGSSSSPDPTSDCGMIETARIGGRMHIRRRRADGSHAFDFEVTRRSSFEMIELEDGSLLLVQLNDAVPPALTILDPNGVVTLDRELDPESVGEAFTYAAFLLTPDGVLYTASSSGLGEQQRLVAIEIGRGPATPYPGRADYHAGLNWARTNAVWH